MSYPITTPVGTDKYGLISDLRNVADQTETYLQQLADISAGAVKPGTSPTFNTVTTTSSPTFPDILISGSRLTSLVVNNATYGFGLRSQNIYLTTKNGTNWASNAPITVPDNGTGAQVVNGNTLAAAVATLNSAITSLTTRVTTIENAYASKTYVSSQVKTATDAAAAVQANLNATNTEVAKKANYSSNVNTVANATYATSAGSATSATTATTATSATKIGGKTVAWGRGVYGTTDGKIPGESTGDYRWGHVVITHNVPNACVVASVYSDDGRMTIISSVGAITATTAEINFRSLGTQRKLDEVQGSPSESFSYSWIAIER